jgi:drug/metabolite transporter (DMT)-like permease
MKTKAWAISVMLFTALLNALGLFFMKKAVIGLSFAMLLDPFLYLSLGSLGLGAVFMVLGFRGGDLSVLYPIIATTYIWMTIFSSVFLGETISSLKWMGIGLIVVGVSIIGGGGRGN